MVERVSDSPYLRELNAMISRAETACERYRHAADEGGLSPTVARHRRGTCQTMEKILTRLRTQKAAAERPSNPGAG